MAVVVVSPIGPAPHPFACSEILVAGFHRSGTSSFTRLLHAAGLFVGDDLIGAMPYNPYGHYEDRAVVGLHNRILLENGLGWQVTETFVPMITAARWAEMERLIEARRRHHRLWGFKDPRVCLFLPAWKHLLPSCKVLITFRNVADCSYSLARRHALELFMKSGPPDVHRRLFDEPDLAARMWIAHNQALLEFAAGYPDDVLTVGFDSLLAGVPLTRLLRTCWDAPLREVPTFAALDPMATQRRVARQPLADPSLGERIDEIWERFLELERRTLAQLDSWAPAAHPGETH